ncbi:SurA N-terminal domain-containing protein [Sulfuriflexus mobilis]|uniref:SurA N-terminal domain-containing protein n=1 Tax=Sulfuriflexus mobilis TaxID=1811807 RepID=UPI000F83E0A6|nr:SurA N-terminal domain-containing protein [Sulfuriflexus mobilis]
MLQSIRDRAQSWVAWIIVLFIVLVFALWGIQDYIGGAQNVDVAEVEGIKISDQDFQRQFQIYRDQQRQQLARILGNDINNPLYKQLLNDASMKQRVIEGMIQSRLMTLAALEAGLRVSDEQLNDIIRAVPSFQRDGQFDADVYSQQLRYQGMSSKGFKSRLEQDTISRQFLEAISSSVFVTPQQVDAWLALQNQQRTLSTITLRAEDFRQEAKIDDERIRAFYDNNISQFMTEEQVSIEYVEFSANSLTAQIEVNEEALREWYEGHVEDYAVADERAQRDVLLAIRKRVLAGEDFAALAKEFSEDKASAENGGDIGLLARNVMEQPFEEALFALNKGDISEPVRTSFGLHLIKLTDIKGEERQASHILLSVDDKKLRTRSFEEVREQVAADYRARESERRFTEQHELLNNLSYEQPTTLEPVAAELKLEIKSTGLFTRQGGEGLAANPAVVNAAFTEDVLAGNNSEALEVGQDKLIVLRIKEHIPAAARPLEEVNDSIIERLLAEVTQALARKQGEAMLVRLKDDAKASVVAEELKLSWSEPESIMRDTSKVRGGIVTTLFAMPRPVADTSNYAGVALPNGDYSLIAFSAVTEFDPSKADESKRLAAQRQLEAAAVESILSALRTDLRLGADVTIFHKNLNGASN